jgi:hypothetical protein
MNGAAVQNGQVTGPAATQASGLDAAAPRQSAFWQLQWDSTAVLFASSGISFHADNSFLGLRALSARNHLVWRVTAALQSRRDRERRP